MIDEKISEGSSQIYQWASEYLSKREIGTANRCSSAPQCVRKGWFQNKGERGEDLQPRQVLVFGLGDLVEHWMKDLIAKSCVGPGKIYSEVDFGKVVDKFIVQHREFNIYEQDELSIHINDFVISGHPDGWGKRNEDGQWELIEIKSAASYGFEDFVKGEIGYLEQVYALSMSTKAIQLGVDSARFWFMNKNTSAIFDRLYKIDPNEQKRVKTEFLQRNGPEMPPVPVSPDIGPINEMVRRVPTGRKILGWKCGYCDYKAKCWPDAKLEFSKTNRPVWVL